MMLVAYVADYNNVLKFSIAVVREMIVSTQAQVVGIDRVFVRFQFMQNFLFHGPSSDACCHLFVDISCVLEVLKRFLMFSRSTQAEVITALPLLNDHSPDIVTFAPTCSRLLFIFYDCPIFYLFVVH